MTCGRSSPAFAQMIHDAWHAQREADGVGDALGMDDRYNVVLHAALHMWNHRPGNEDGAHLTDAGGFAGTRSTRGLGSPMNIHPRAETFSDKGGNLTDEQKNALSDFYRAGDSDGWFGKLHVLFIANAPSEDAAKLDLVAPVKDGAPNVLTVRNGQSAVPWVAGQGFKLDNTVSPKPGYDLPVRPNRAEPDDDGFEDDLGIVVGIDDTSTQAGFDVSTLYERTKLEFSDKRIYGRLQSVPYATWEGLDQKADQTGVYIVQRKNNSVSAYRLGDPVELEDGSGPDTKTGVTYSTDGSDAFVLGAIKNDWLLSGRIVSAVGVIKSLTDGEAESLSNAISDLIAVWKVNL